ncbi:dienelactone hydrolase family protein [Actinoalloteichus spitiensis]|uniref:dienelactone hydrolase family protein n=1 Tax=Actinoalloteichus spitiensis TaxID=252394 RepID=UPI00037DDBC1|nr:dienelactone hydrolase family protein [Actinoalloteichus spitiensis]
MARFAKKLIAELSQPGPHGVLRGDLALVGLPGTVITPRQGLGLPAVAFGHGWMQPIRRYRDLLRHLASWGFVVAAPATHQGLLPSHRLFASDLHTALEVCAKVRLGSGEISVDPERLGVVGHSFGAGAAVLAAANWPEIRAVVTLAVTETRPSAINAARDCGAPALHLAAEEDRIAPPVAMAEPVSHGWKGPVQLRTVRRANHLTFAEGRHWTDLLMDGRPRRQHADLVKALTTAFLLRVLTDDRRYDTLLETEVKGATLDYSRGRRQDRRRLPA